MWRPVSSYWFNFFAAFIYEAKRKKRYFILNPKTKYLILFVWISDTQRYVVTFTTSQSYIEVPGWRKGDIAFSFRTTGTSAILLFQPPIRPNYPSFMVALTSGKLVIALIIYNQRVIVGISPFWLSTKFKLVDQMFHKTNLTKIFQNCI